MRRATGAVVRRATVAAARRAAGVTGRLQAAATAAAARGQSQLVRVFFPAQFAPFLHKNPELLLDGFDNFLGNPLVHSCYMGTDNSKNLFSDLFHFLVDFYNICFNLHSEC